MKHSLLMTGNQPKGDFNMDEDDIIMPDEDEE
jgi:hypothetical protein